MLVRRFICLRLIADYPFKPDRHFGGIQAPVFVTKIGVQSLTDSGHPDNWCVALLPLFGKSETVGQFH